MTQLSSVAAHRLSRMTTGNKALLRGVALPALALAGLMGGAPAQAQTSDGNQDCTSTNAPRSVYNVACQGHAGAPMGGAGNNSNGASGNPGKTARVDDLTTQGESYTGRAGLSTINLTGTGGNGGTGQQGGLSTNGTNGGTGGTGGNGAELNVTVNGGTIQDAATAYAPILLLSQGGTGGGGGAFGMLRGGGSGGNGGAGGTGGNGGQITFALNAGSGGASVISSQSGIAAIDIASIGGGGGNAASSSLDSDVKAEQGGWGGSGGPINVTLQASTTIQSHGVGLRVRSVAAAGGVGGNAAASRGDATSGAGGNGGYGGNIHVQSAAQIQTSGSGSIGIEAASLGGDGGARGSASASRGTAHGGAGGDAKSGNNVTVTNAAGGSIATNGDLAHGILAQSVGGNGGAGGNGGGRGPNGGSNAVAVTTAGTVTTMGSRSIGLFAQSLSGQGGPDGQAGQVKVDVSNLVSTAGRDSYGILAQSVGGGVLFDPDGSVDPMNVDQPFGTGFRDGYAGVVAVALHDGGSIQTQGDGAVGILAQSIGGAGGLIGGMSDVDVTQRFHVTPANHGGTGGTVDVTLEPGSRIETFGTRAHAIVAQNVVGGGFFAAPQGDGDGFTAVGAGCTPPNCAGISKIEISVNGIVQTHGADSHAIFAQNYGAIGPSTVISIGGNGVIGSDKAATIYIDSSGTNVINNGGYLGGSTSIDGSPATINNGYFLYGNIYSTGRLHQLNNGGTLWGSATIAANITNTGRIVLGRQGDVVTHVAGNLNSTGDIISNVDGNGNISVLRVAGHASVSGRILFWDRATPTIGTSQGILYATGGITLGSLGFGQSIYDANTEQFAVEESAVAKYSATLEPDGTGPAGAQVLVINTEAKGASDFASESLSDNQAAVLDALAETFNAGQGGGLYDVLAANVRSEADYARFLDTAGGETLGAAASSRLTLQRSFITSMMSCPVYDEAGLALHEESCAWARVQGSWINSDRNTGYMVDSQRYQMGFQKEVSDGWFVGASTAYEMPTINSSAAAAHFSGDIADLGAFVKHETGAWTLAGSVSGAFGRYRTRREVMFSDTAATASIKVQNFGLQGRVVYQAAFKGLYLRPSLNVTAQYLHMGAFTETGSDLPLAVSASSDWSWSIEPNVEIGSRLMLGKAVLRPFLRGGLLYEGSNNWRHSIRFAKDNVGLGSFTSHIDLPRTAGALAAGIELHASDRLSIRAEYNAELASRWTSQSAVGRIAYRF